MLQRWGAFTPSDTLPAAASSLFPQKETSEHRELRLRNTYEQALQQHRTGATDSARHLFEQLRDDLSISELPHSAPLPRRDFASGRPSHAKRPRVANVPLWERKLRYVVHRNLAEVYVTDGDFSRALAAYATALDDDRSDFLIWVRAARAALACGRLHVARRAFETAMIMRPGHWLCQTGYRAVLHAIGDADEDCAKLKRREAEELDREVAEVLRERCRCMEREAVEMRAENEEGSEVLRLKESSWTCLVDEVCGCLERRLGEQGEERWPVGHPVTFEHGREGSHDRDESGDGLSGDGVSPPSLGLQAGNWGDENRKGVVEVTTSGTKLWGRRPPECKRTEAVDLPGSGQVESQAAHKLTPPPFEAEEIPFASHPPNALTVKDVDGTREEVHRSSAGRVGNSANDANADDVKNSQAEKDLGNSVANPGSRVDMVAGQEEHSSEEDEKRPEVRRSSRQRALVEELPEGSERRDTRTTAGVRGSAREDKDLARRMLQLCLPQSAKGQNVMSGSASKKKNGDAVFLERSVLSHREESKKRSAWTRVVTESQEVADVENCIASLNEANSGPADILLRVLKRLLGLSLPQYSSTVAVLWLTLRKRLQIHNPGSAATSAFVAEALVDVGREHIEIAFPRLAEAGRLLAHVKLPPVGESQTAFLRIRMLWIHSILLERRGEMQRAFACAARTKSLVQSLDPSWSDKEFPDISGQELAGRTSSELCKAIDHRMAGLRRARDVEQAREELAKHDDGDAEAAVRAISILSSSVRSSVQHLAADSWNYEDNEGDARTSAGHSGPTERERTETELESQLHVFGEACAKASDTVGELVCFSLRLRMSMRSYASTPSTAIEPTDVERSGRKDSGVARLAEMLVQIRKYVAVIKKASLPASSDLWGCTPGICGWSMEEAARVASITLVSLASLIVTEIPLLRFYSGNPELGASQKNRRLGFTRCMLAFARCVFLLWQSQQNASDTDTEASGRDESPVTKNMLRAVSLCLKALAARGCCREEGTSGALIKLYIKFLSARLHELSCCSLSVRSNAISSQVAADKLANRCATTQEASENRAITISTKMSSDGMDSNLCGEVSSSEADQEYDWDDVAMVRLELAQCFKCMYHVQKLDSVVEDLKNPDDVRWLEEGCLASRQIGLSFSTGEPSNPTPAMDVDICKSVYLFYRRDIFEDVCLRRRDGGRGKRVREVISQLAEALPEDPPKSMRMLPFRALDTIVSDVVATKGGISQGAAESVSRLRGEWVQCDGDAHGSSMDGIRSMQLSVLFFEVFALHSVSLLAAHDSEYKKQKTAERRRRPREAAERLQIASSECIVALQCRPWSVGAWILLGRIFVEISDLALDERELSMSSFGLYRVEDVDSLGEDDTVETVLGRAEACFGFAASLLKHPWATEASSIATGLEVWKVLGLAYTGKNCEAWSGFGDDGDLFGRFGLTNETTSRPIFQAEIHPAHSQNFTDRRRMAAVRFGEAALSMLRLRERRYFHRHWTENALNERAAMSSEERFPRRTTELGAMALRQLREGQSLIKVLSTSHEEWERDSKGKTGVRFASCREADSSRFEHEWREGYFNIERYQWYYTFLEAKLVLKTDGHAEEYLPIFRESWYQNRKQRELQKQPADIEPLYKLHALRMKLLRSVGPDRSEAIRSLTLLEEYSYHKSSIVVEDADVAGRDVDDWIAERKIAVAEDIMSAMLQCCDPKSDAPYAEYFFKATYCRAQLLVGVLRDVRGALAELGKLLNIDAAAKTFDQGPDGAHRGYFYKMWNYRFTDTGIEPALESERKLIRWRSKILGLYAMLLRKNGDWRLLAAIICRLKKRSSEDLPIDGALLDDLIFAYAITSRAAILNSTEKGILTNAAVCESSYRRTWDIYIETLRLEQGVRRVRMSLARKELGETGADRLIYSRRPRCLVAINTVLRLEYIRWKSASSDLQFSLEDMKALPVGGVIRSIHETVRLGFVETLQVSASKWPVDDKLMRMLVRRISEYSVSDA